MFDVAHGAGLAAVWGSWARYVYKARPERFAKFARNIFNIQETDDEKAAVAGIEAMENYYRSVGMPTSLCELGIHATEEQIKEMADKCSFYGKRTVGVMKKIGAPGSRENCSTANDVNISSYPDKNFQKELKRVIGQIKTVCPFFVQLIQAMILSCGLQKKN